MIPKIGDRVKCSIESFTGTIIHIENECISIKRDDGRKGGGYASSWHANLSEFENKDYIILSNSSFNETIKQLLEER